MSGSNNPVGGRKPTLFEAGTKILSVWDKPQDCIYDDLKTAIEKLREATAIDRSDSENSYYDGLISKLDLGMKGRSIHLSNRDSAMLIRAIDGWLLSRMVSIKRSATEQAAVDLWRTHGEGRAMRCPDHLDLCLWLLELVNEPGPSIDPDDVWPIMARLERSWLARALDADLGSDAGELIERLSSALIRAERRLKLAEAGGDQ